MFLVQLWVAQICLNQLGIPGLQDLGIWLPLDAIKQAIAGTWFAGDQHGWATSRIAQMVRFQTQIGHFRTSLSDINFGSLQLMLQKFSVDAILEDFHMAWWYL